MLSLVLVVVGATAISLASGISAKGRYQEVTQEELLPDETIKEDTDNEYVILNNKLVQAISDYQDGKISQEEYESICGEVYNKIDTKQEEKNIKQQEEEYRESTGE